MPDLYVHDLARMDRAEAEEAIRARVQSAFIGDDVTLARILGRNKIFLRNGDLGFACHLMMDGYWEIWLTLFSARYLKPGMVAVDVGANFGYYTLLFADCVGASGRVLAVEPNPQTAALLRRTTVLNGVHDRVRIEQVAFGREAEGTARLFVPEGEPKNATVLPVSGVPGWEIEVRTTSLDALAKDLPRLDFVKVDAEGAEANIVAGMEETIARHRPALVLEFNAARLVDPGATLDRLGVYGQELRRIDFEGNVVAVERERVLASQEDFLLFFV